MPDRRGAGVEPVSGNDSGDVRAMPVVVVCRRLSVDEINEAIDALPAPGIGKIIVRRRHAGIDHRDGDAGPVITEHLARRVAPTAALVLSRVPTAVRSSEIR